MQVKKYKFQPHGDYRGQLVAIEQCKDIPFEIKRVYYVYDTEKGVTRGFHAHKKLKQILVCIHGSCKIGMDDGFEKREVCLDNPEVGLYIENAIWRTMYDFSEGAVLLVLASELYDENDYIREYDSFLEYVSHQCEE